tara:strand:+ start:616 stop:861 length:246 start_codon:yes stop_codon:yes gene_type:complete
MTDQDTETQRKCDLITHRAAEMMIEQGASLGMALDRMLTFSAAQACKADGAFHTAAVFRSIAEQIEIGKFAHVEPKGHGGH